MLIIGPGTDGLMMVVYCNIPDPDHFWDIFELRVHDLCDKAANSLFLIHFLVTKAYLKVN